MRLHRLIDPLLPAFLALKGRKGQPRGVLFISAGGLGDTVLFALVLPRLMRLAHAGEPVTVLLRADAAKMAFLFPQGVQVAKLDFARLRHPGFRYGIARALHDAHYRLVVHTDYLRHPDLDEFLVRAAAAPETAAMEPRPSAKHGRRLKANHRLYRRLFDSGPALQDKFLRWWRFADFLLGECEAPPKISLPPDRLLSPANLETPTAVLQPFSAVGFKQCRPETWKVVIDSLPVDWQVRVAGHPSDLDRNPEFRPLLDGERVVFEPAPFAELAPILRAARLVVSVDTACMHLAAALGAPTLCLASAAYVGEIVPYDEAVAPANLRVLWRPMACQGCLGACVLPKEGGMYPCVARLDLQAIARAVQDMAASEPA